MPNGSVIVFFRTCTYRAYNVLYSRFLSWDSCKVLCDSSSLDVSRSKRNFAITRSVSVFSRKTVRNKIAAISHAQSIFITREKTKRLENISIFETTIYKYGITEQRAVFARFRVARRIVIKNTSVYYNIIVE